MAASSQASVAPPTTPKPVAQDADVEKAARNANSNSPTTSNSEAPYSIFTKNEKRFMVLLLTVAALFSPVSSTIYYPALVPIAKDLNVSNSLVNLTVTSFMIFQGLAPAFTGAFADAEGRRLAYVACFVMYMGANIGLALQNNYAALIVLRCLQSSGSSGTIALANAVVSDIAGPSERGTYMGWANAGAFIGPAIGPVIGGLLSQFLGWHSIFWFLTIFGGVYLIIIIVFFPESGRNVVGNGSRRPPPWNWSILEPRLKKRIAADSRLLCPPIPSHPLRFPNPLKTLEVLGESEAALILVTSGLLFAGFYMVMAVLPTTLEKNYGFNTVLIGLCFLPSGAASSLSAVFMGKLMDWNFRRHATRLGLDASDTRRLRSLASFPIEAARLELTIPAVALGTCTIISFGWVMHFNTNLAGPLVLLFFNGIAVTGCISTLSALIVDLFPEKPATATAAANLTRCLLGAGATAVVVPMVDGIGIGWTFTIVALLWLVLLPPLWAIIKWGPGMRKRKAERLALKKADQQEKERKANVLDSTNAEAATQESIEDKEESTK